MEIGSQQGLKRRSERKPWVMRTTSLICLLLLTLLTFVQVAHVHPAATDADHCPICVVMHSAAPVAVAAAVVVLVRIGTSAPVLAERPIIRYWHPTLFTRPPPAGC